MSFVRAEGLLAFLRCSLLLLALGLGFAPAPARAHGPAELLAAIAAYDEGELDKAQRHLTAALASPLSESSRGLAWFYRGLALAARNDGPAAAAAFERSLAHDPQLAPDRPRMLPLALGLFDSARRRLAGEVQVEASELAAKVFIDDRPHGLAPARVELQVGAHQLRVTSADGLRSYEQSLVVQPRARLAIRALLAADFGYLHLGGDVPAGAEVLLDGRPLARLPAPRLPVPAGPHLLVLRAPGAIPAALEVVVEARKDLPLRLRSELAKQVPTPWYGSKRTWAWAGVAVAATSAALGVGFGLWSRSLADDARARTAAGTLSVEDYNGLLAAARTRTTAANAFFGVAGAAAVAGVVLFALGGDGERPTLRLSLELARIVLVKRF